MTENGTPNPPASDIVPQQLALLESIDGMTLQTRYEQFTERAIDILTSQDGRGEPVFDAGSAKCTMTVKVSIERTANDALAFTTDHNVKETHPNPPGKLKTGQVVRGVGLAQRVTDQGPPLFNPEDGQPRPLTLDEARNALPKEQ